MTNRIAFNASFPSLTRSEALYQRARACIPGATQTLAKGATQYVDGVAPKFLTHGRGAYVFDADGNEYLDMVMGLGPISLGYAFPAVDAAIRAQLEHGISFSLVHPLEVELAERVCQLVPCAEMVRFSKTGADVTSAAIRLARAYTGRDKVLGCGYHGWHDWHIGTTSRARGIPRALCELSRNFAYNDLDDLARKLDRDTACVILEPVAFQLPEPGFLQGVRALCDERGAVLIFDEMWTGFRAALGGAQARFGVTPDLACFSKAIANGMPLSVLCGSERIMRLCEQDDFFFFTTFGGETLSLAAARATIEQLHMHDVPTHLQQLGERLRSGLTEQCGELGLDGLRCTGLACRTQLAWVDTQRADPLLVRSLIQQELIRCGVLWSGFHALSFSHTIEDVDYLLGAYREALRVLSRALATNSLARSLRGAPIRPVFGPPSVSVPLEAQVSPVVSASAAALR